MPERLMAMTNGDAAAVPLPNLRPGSFEGTSSPMIVTPPIQKSKIRMFTRRIAFRRLRLGFFTSPAVVWKYILIKPRPTKTGMHDMLSGRTHGDVFGAGAREGCLGQNGPKTKETPFRARNALILDERTRVSPITETDAIVIGASPKVEDKSQNNQS